MCVCGGIIEAGLICAAVGVVSKAIHHCKCKCHEQHECEHCHNENHVELDKSEKDKRNIKYKKIQNYLIGFIIGGLILIGGALIYEHCFEHHHCSDEHYHHIHHTEKIHK